MVERNGQRKLKRNLTPDEEEQAINVGKVLCVSGGHLEKWVPLEVSKHDMQECVRVNAARTAWLNIVLTAYAASTPSTKLAVDKVFDELRTAQQNSSADSSAVVVPEGVSDAAREVLNQMSSSDEEEENSQASPRKARVAEVWATVECSAGQITFKPCRSNHFLIHVDSLATFIQACIDSYKISKRHVLRIPQSAADEIVPEDLLTDEDKSRIVFDFRYGAWKVLYRNTPRQQKTRMSKDGLEIPEKRMDGTAWSPKEYREVVASVLIKARRLWNALDASGAARLDVGETA